MAATSPRTLSALLVFMLAMGLAPMPQVSAGPGVTEKSLALAGVTTVRGERPGSVVVKIPRDVDLDATYEGPVDAQPPVSFDGDGRIVAFALTQVLPDGSGYGATFGGWRAGLCHERGCKTVGKLHSVFVVDNLDSGRGRVLPAGLYRLYFFADGAEASVRLEFPGLEGRTTIIPRGPIKADLQSVQAGPVSTSSGDPIYSAGASTNLSGPGFPALSFWVKGDGEAVRGIAGQCIYEEQPPPGDAYVPPCPTSNRRAMSDVRARHTEVAWFNEDFQLWRAAGAWYATPSKLKTAGAVALWIEF